MSRSEVEPIAIVGIGCRFPGAEDPAAFWSLLSQGREAVGRVPEDRYGMEALPRSSSGAPVSDRGGFLEQVAGLDWRALRIGPREASYMDPQHRLALELAWEALEDAGLPFEAVAGTRTAVFMGISWGDYARMQARCWSRLDGYTAAGTPFAFAANRISYAFDLRGPSFALDATCSSSLVAVSQGCHALWSGEATMALAGGVNLMLSPDTTLVMSRAGVLSASGHCRALDAEADGFVRGEGAGLVVLVPASRVREDDRVYAWIRGVAVGHNGRNEWIMAPSAEGQARTIAEACRRAGVGPRELQYVELHGTGFGSGDVVETQALGMAFAADGGRDRPCVIGSVKTNLGNLEAAAGIASVIKVALALHHAEIPRTLNLEVANPRIEFEDWGLAPARSSMPWPAEGARRAGVSTTSLSGVNAHAVLEADEREKVASPAHDEGRFVVPLSARTPQGLVAMATKVGQWLGRPDRPPLLDIAYTASLRRSHHEHRVAAVGDAAAIAEALLAFARGEQRPNLFHGDEGGEAAAGLDAVARRHASGHAVDWREVLPEGGRCVSLPTQAWQRERMWLPWLDRDTIGTPPECMQGDASPTAAEAEANQALRRELLHAPLARARASLVGYLQGLLRDALGLGATATIGYEQPLFELGVSSLTAVELRNRFQVELGVVLPSSLLLEHPTVSRLAAHLLELMRGREPVESDEAVTSPEPPTPSDDLRATIDRLSEQEAEQRLIERLADLEEQLR